MDDIHLALSNDREQYGPAFALRQTIYHEFGRKKEVKEVIEDAFGLPAGGWGARVAQRAWPKAKTGDEKKAAHQYTFVDNTWFATPLVRAWRHPLRLT